VAGVQGLPAALPPCTGEALAAAFFLDFTYRERPAKQAAASPWYQAAAALAGDCLGARARQAPPARAPLRPGAGRACTAFTAPSGACEGRPRAPRRTRWARRPRCWRPCSAAATRSPSWPRSSRAPTCRPPGGPPWSRRSARVRRAPRPARMARDAQPGTGLGSARNKHPRDAPAQGAARDASAAASPLAAPPLHHTSFYSRPCAEQAERAAALVEEEWPDEAEAAAARAAAREAATPVPERVWALQNVGSTLALQGPAGLARARQLLERAVLLKAEWVGGARHPGAPWRAGASRPGPLCPRNTRPPASPRAAARRPAPRGLTPARSGYTARLQQRAEAGAWAQACWGSWRRWPTCSTARASGRPTRRRCARACWPSTATSPSATCSRVRRTPARPAVPVSRDVRARPGRRSHGADAGARSCLVPSSGRGAGSPAATGGPGARAGDGASACALLEAATREMEERLGLGHPGVRAASRRAENLFAALSADERARVRAAPRSISPAPLLVVASRGVLLFRFGKRGLALGGPWARKCGLAGLATRARAAGGGGQAARGRAAAGGRRVRAVAGAGRGAQQGRAVGRRRRRPGPGVMRRPVELARAPRPARAVRTSCQREVCVSAHQMHSGPLGLRHIRASPLWELCFSWCTFTLPSGTLPVSSLASSHWVSCYTQHSTERATPHSASNPEEARQNQGGAQHHQRCGRRAAQPGRVREDEVQQDRQRNLRRQTYRGHRWPCEARRHSVSASARRAAARMARFHLV